MLLDFKGLGSKYFEALVGSQGNAAVVPVEGDCIYDLDWFSGEQFNFLVILKHI